MAPPDGQPLAGSIARLALFALAVALITSRVGLVTHELVGHGGAALACDAEIAEVRLYVFAGGWISYQRAAPWTWPEALVVQLAGIAIELLLAGVAAVAAWRARCAAGRSSSGALAVAFGGAALGLVVHAGFYLAAGTYHGVGDGALLYRALGDDRIWLALPLALAVTAVTFAGARLLAATVRAWLPARSAAGQVAALGLALGLAGGAHAGLAAVELAARPSPTYRAIMRPARDQAIDHDLARWAQVEATRGRPPDRAATTAHRRQLDDDRPAELPFGLVLGLAIAVAGAAGVAAGRPVRGAAGPDAGAATIPGTGNGQLVRPRGRSIPASFVARRSLTEGKLHSSRLAIGAARPRSPIDLSIPGPLPLSALRWAVTAAVIAALSMRGIDALAP